VTGFGLELRVMAMGLAMKRSSFMGKIRLSLSFSMPLALIVSTLSIVSIVAPQTASANTVISVRPIGGITAPGTFNTPVSTVTATTSYTGTVSWSPTPVNSKFVESTTYTATITLTAKVGFTLTGVTSNFFTVTGATTVTNNADSGVVTAVYPATLAAYNGTSGAVACGSGGSFTVANNVVSTSSGCNGPVTVPEGITELGIASLCNNSNSCGNKSANVGSVTLPSTLVRINNFALMSSGLTSINFAAQSSLTTIGIKAFSYKKRDPSAETIFFEFCLLRPYPYRMKAC
jgi:hypothetical protein